MDDEPDRLARDRREVAEFAPDLRFVEPRSPEFLHGGWIGRLPLWPFERAEPDGLLDLVGVGAEVAVAFSAAHPMVPPRIRPLTPEPAIEERTQAVWHVAPDGSLCLLQSQGQWQPDASVTELLLKAAGWHVEYALMKTGAIEKMTECGIVNDDSLDSLIASAVERLGEATFAEDAAAPRHVGDSEREQDRDEQVGDPD
jgi:hypothetical protein